MYVKVGWAMMQIYTPRMTKLLRNTWSSFDGTASSLLDMRDVRVDFGARMIVAVSQI